MAEMAQQDITKQVVQELANRISLDSTRFVEGFVALFYDKIIREIKRKKDVTDKEAENQEDETDLKEKKAEESAEVVENLFEEVQGWRKDVADKFKDLFAGRNVQQATQDQADRTDQIKKTPEFIISSFSSESLNQLVHALHDTAKEKATKDAQSKGPEDRGGGLFAALFGVIDMIGGAVGALRGGLIPMALGFGKKIVTKIASLGKLVFSKIKTVIMAPFKWVQSLFKVGGGVADDAIKVASKGAGAGLLARLGGGLGKFLGAVARKLPFIGAIFSLGRAFMRVKDGDYVGGAINVLSALASLIPAPMISIPLMIAAEALNGFLDSKTEGAENKNVAKLNILKDMAVSVRTWIWDKLKNLPIVTGLVDTVEFAKKGEWGKAWVSMLKIIPGTGFISGFIMDLMGGEEAVAARAQSSIEGGINFVSNAWNWIKEKVGNWPIFQWIGSLGEKFAAGDWGGAFRQLIEYTPFGWFVGLLEHTAEEVGRTMTEVSGEGFSVTDFVSNMVTMGKEKLTKFVENLPVIGPLIKAIQTGNWDSVLESLSWIPGLPAAIDMLKSAKGTIGSWFKKKPELDSSKLNDDKTKEADKTSKLPVELPTALPVESEVEDIKEQQQAQEAAPTISLGEEFASLTDIAQNTGQTNIILVELAKVLVKLAENQGGTAVINNQVPSPSSSGSKLFRPSLANVSEPVIRDMRDLIRTTFI